MTEQEWITWNRSPVPMCKQFAQTAPARKLRLLAAACCRLVWDHIPHAQAHNAILTVERYADDMGAGVPDEEFAHAATTARSLRDDTLATSEPFSPARSAICAVEAATHSNAAEAVGYCFRCVVDCASMAAERGKRQAAKRAMQERIRRLFREVIGNPFRPWKSVAPFLGGGVVQPDGQTVHLTDTVRQLAHGIHVDQAFDRLPILADALEESGITDADLLAHCRSETRHVRGCWALDVALGRV